MFGREGNRRRIKIFTKRCVKTVSCFFSYRCSSFIDGAPKKERLVRRKKKKLLTLERKHAFLASFFSFYLFSSSLPTTEKNQYPFMDGVKKVAIACFVGNLETKKKIQLILVKKREREKKKTITHRLDTS